MPHDLDEKALEAAMKVGSNIADEFLVREIIAAYESAKPAPEPSAEMVEAVAWVPQEHLDFLAEGRANNRPSNALVHDRPHEEMGWTVPLYAGPMKIGSRLVVDGVEAVVVRKDAHKGAQS